MKREEIFMLVVAFILGLCFKSILGSVCGGRLVEGITLFDVPLDTNLEDNLEDIVTDTDNFGLIATSTDCSKLISASPGCDKFRDDESACVLHYEYNLITDRPCEHTGRECRQSPTKKCK